MKKLILWALLFPIALMAQTNQVYTIQIGTFVNPQKADFNLIESFGYLSAEPFENNFHKVFLGDYPTEYNALAVLKIIKERGFSGFVVPKELKKGEEVIVVQFTTEKKGVPINWKAYESVGKLYVSLNDPERIKLLTGPFKNRIAAMKRIADIQAQGYTDAFMRTINTGLLHEVGDFEKGVNQVQNNLNTAVETILSDAIPANYGDNTPVIQTSKNVNPTSQNNSAAIAPNIRPLIKRTSALDIQKLLKANEFFKGSLDGFYGKATSVGYENFTSTDLQFKKYALLSSFFERFNEKADLDLQGVINNLPSNPARSIQQLNNVNQPISKAYQAYWLLVNNGNITEINRLMNTAIKETFADKKIKNAPPFDFSANYSYEDLTQFILHLRYLHAAPINSDYSIPCWLFERHPEESFAAFKTKSKFASFANTKIESCKTFDQWESIRIMKAMLQDMSPAALTDAQKERQKSLAAARNFQYLFPEKLSKKEKKGTEEWLTTFMKQMDSSAENYPVLGKNLVAFKILFFQSQVLLEDFFMNKEFTPDAAEGLALSVLKTYVDVPLEVYGQ